MKHRKLHQWLLHWHFIAGIIMLPFVLILAVTGGIYLFKNKVEQPILQNYKVIANSNQAKLSLQKQYDIATNYMKRKPNAMTVSKTNQATEFIWGRFSHKQSIFVNPYTGEITGKFSPKDTWMYKIRKLHGELLGGKFGTKIVELIASWMVVLILGGIYIWWPFSKGNKGLFTIRFNQGKRTLFRDLHAVLGFWFSLLLLLTLAGGFPWTDVFGDNFKWVQKATNTGYPKGWNGQKLASQNTSKTLSVDKMFSIANQQGLPGTLSLNFPKTANHTFKVSNKNLPLATQKSLLFNPYTGKLVKQFNWSDVGFLMRGRMWLMAFHQGEFGLWNFILMFIVAIGLTLLTLGAIFSYAYRKPADALGIPKVPNNYKLSIGIISTIVLLGIVFPLFGISILLIFIIQFIFKKG